MESIIILVKKLLIIVKNVTKKKNVINALMSIIFLKIIEHFAEMI